jgi:glycosyltransferase involved in cell wall biosynthesis
MENNFKEQLFDVIRIEGEQCSTEISSGLVLDGIGRGVWATTQVANFLKQAEKIFKKVGYPGSDNIVFYFDDFWHPGIEAIPYFFHVRGLPNPRMFAFSHAQSVDEFDFTVGMLPWIRQYEKANASVLEGIFVSAPLLKRLHVSAGVGSNKTVHAVGLPYRSKDARALLPAYNPDAERKNKVVYTSRWDAEKRPERFLKMLDLFCESSPDLFKDIEFVITTSAKRLKSNNSDLITMLNEYLLKYPNLILKERLTKSEYYAELSTAFVQVNTGDQDWVSFTLLEALTFGCIPFYPNFRSFPDVFGPKSKFLYDDIYDLVDCLSWAFNNKKEGFSQFLLDSERIKLENIYKTHDKAVERMCCVMTGRPYESAY